VLYIAAVLLYSANPLRADSVLIWRLYPLTTAESHIKLTVTYLLRFTQFLEDPRDDPGTIVTPVVTSEFIPEVI
jgi:hypothetical protein